MERQGGPVALALTRQKVPTFDRREVASVEGVMRGAYTLWQSGDGEPEVILLATGSEVQLALAAARQLDANARVVSMPCWELFAEQTQEYRDEVLPPSVEARVSVEAGITFGWERWVGAARHIRRRRPLRRIGAVPADPRGARAHRGRGRGRGGRASWSASRREERLQWRGRDCTS